MSEPITPREILQKQGALAPDVVAAQVNGALTDLHTPVASDARVEPIRDSDPRALEVIRHSTAHVMADAVQRLFPGTQVTIGPAIDNGFYYDFDRPDGAFTEEDLRRIEETMFAIIAKDHPFRREVVSREDARKLFESMGEKYKLELLDRAEGEISIYRHGEWVDLCKGPHVPSTRFLRALKLTSVAGAYWRGDERNKMLQRIYGTAFPSKEALVAYLESIEQAKLRDHRKLGKELELVWFSPLAPASPFFLPRGARVYNLVIDYVRRLYDRYGYQEVITPQIFDNELFRTSGHLPGYAENMFLALTVEDIEDKLHEAVKGKDAKDAFRDAVVAATRFGVKPMNCPSHCAVFASTRRSYRELPLRMADFGRLHRYERSGVVQGLTRVRTFAQDDAHIFCRLDQVQGEIAQFLDLVIDVYRDFGFSDVRFVLATRPTEKLGSDEVWDTAEKALEDGLKGKGLEYTIAEGEGAFYGPKIEFHLKDALGRPWQLATIQADFNMPERFELAYVGEDNAEHRPVMLHRAIVGSVERFLGVLIEHVGGAFPTWLAPEQVALLTVSEKFTTYAREALDVLTRAGVRATADLSGDKLGAKIARARHMRYPYLAVIGQKEVEARGLAIRSRDEQKDLGLVTLDAFIAKIRSEGLAPSERR